ncbi:4970_t:CDS:1, partial [Dentiscutata erythropus]
VVIPIRLYPFYRMRGAIAFNSGLQLALNSAYIHYATHSSSRNK